MVVDVDHSAGSLRGRDQATQPVLRAAVQGQEQVRLFGDFARLHDGGRLREKSVVEGNLHALGSPGRPRLLAQPAQRHRRSKNRPDRVSVGVHVAGDDDRFGLLKGGNRRIPVREGSGHQPSPSASCSSRRIDSNRWASSGDLSSSKVSSGVYLRRIW